MSPASLAVRRSRCAAAAAPLRSFLSQAYAVAIQQLSALPPQLWFETADACAEPTQDRCSKAHWVQERKVIFCCMDTARKDVLFVMAMQLGLNPGIQTAAALLGQIIAMMSSAATGMVVSKGHQS